MAEITPVTSVPASGFVEGADVLVSLNGVEAGHSTGHTLTYSTETKTRQVKPTKDKGISAGLFKSKVVVGLDIKCSLKGLRFYGDTGANHAALLDAWYNRKPVKLTAFNRTEEATPYLKAKFIVTNVSEDNNPGDDASYSADLEIAEAPEVFDVTKAKTGTALPASV